MKKTTFSFEFKDIKSCKDCPLIRSISPSYGNNAGSMPKFYCGLNYDHKNKGGSCVNSHCSNETSPEWCGLTKKINPLKWRF
jgi:hypothetical protein